MAENKLLAIAEKSRFTRCKFSIVCQRSLCSADDILTSYRGAVAWRINQGNRADLVSYPGFTMQRNEFQTDRIVRRATNAGFAACRLRKDYVIVIERCSRYANRGLFVII